MEEPKEGGGSGGAGKKQAAKGLTLVKFACKLRKPGSTDASTDYAHLSAGDFLWLEVEPHPRIRWTRELRSGGSATRYVPIAMVQFYEQ